MLSLAPLLAALCLPAGTADPPARPNVLLIVADDLRPELGCYGVASASTPHLDRFADTAVLFERAYCQVPTCGASRASLFTGLRPTRDRFRNYLTRVEEDAPDVVPLHAHFKNAGYRTASLGKVLHHKNDSPAGWTDPPWRPQAPTYALPDSFAAAEKAEAAGTRAKRGPPVEAADVPDDFYADGKIAAEAADRLRNYAESGEPFFLAVGFMKPHLPFVAPRKYWDRHPADAIPMPTNYERPAGAPDAAIHDSGELRSYAGVPPKGPVSDAMAKDLIRGYRACVSLTDANVGRVLDALGEAGLAGNTVVVVTSDHGWNLGEHTLWCKHSCFETSLRVPLLIRAPGVTAAGGTAAGLTELLDIYPTLCDLAGLEHPAHLAGASLAAGLSAPDTLGKPAAVSRYVFGDTLRTDAYRFTTYARPAGPPENRRLEPLGTMLYDHRADPGETVNVADEEPGVAKELRTTLKAVRNQGRRGNRAESTPDQSSSPPQP